MMGRELEIVNEAPAGNVIGINHDAFIILFICELLIMSGLFKLLRYWWP